MAVGAIGGSGTRVLARIIQSLGYFIGNDLNNSIDNLSFSRTFKNIGILNLPDSEFNQLAEDFSRDMIRFMIAENATRWGWKEPNTHIVIDRLRKVLPGLKYIHVIRNGLDMAHSGNQNQPRFWGSHFLGGPVHSTITPRYSLKYWCAVQKRIIRISENEDISSDILFIRYEDLCKSPQKTIAIICDFIGCAVSTGELVDLSRLVSPPASIGRWRDAGTSIFDQEDVDYVASLGFDVT